MKISRRSDYALRAMLTLVDHYGQGAMSLSELARRNDIPKQFLEHIMLDLKKEGWVKSLPGRSGGYELARSPDSISMGQIIRLFDGMLAPIGCVSVNVHEPCSQSTSCRFRRVLLDIRNQTTKYLESATLAKVANLKPVSEPEVFQLSFYQGDGI